ncbi:MAG TPA: penicillin-binding protein 2 [Gaiellaceae bacterium]|nr:penicillin-binding protein 2 [Gaiellaceae bacterium]
MASATADERPRSKRFMPPSKSVVEPYRPSSRLLRRVSALGVAMLVVFAVLLLRLWALQVLAGTKYVDQAAANSFRTVRVQAPRGEVLDRNGVPLVTNAPATAILLWPADLPKVYTRRYEELRSLASLTRVPLYQIAAGIKARRQANDLVTPVTVREAANEPMIDFLYEHSTQFPGVTTWRTFIRHYPYHSLAAQVLGYVGEISPSELEADAKEGYRPGDEIGQSGVEASYDTYLRGVAGSARMHIDAFGRPRSNLETTTIPKAGNNVRLTIDLKLQQAAEKALQYGIHLAQANKKWYARGGAIVALDPTNGSILAMASSPTYDPSVYAGHVTERELASAGLTAESAPAKNYPSLDRATSGTYPPGSTFKPVTAVAAIAEGLLSPSALYPCTPTYSSPQDRSHRTFHNWDPNVDEGMNLETALEESCDTYFYRFGNAFYNLPADRGQPLQRWAEMFGLGAPTGVDVGPEAAGLVPTIGWRKRHFASAVDKLWKPGDSIELAVGQGDLLVTPLQMARVYAAIANGGKLVTPHLLDAVETPNGTSVPVPPISAPKEIGINPAALHDVQLGLWDATHVPTGTGYAVFSKFAAQIAGKTGTAEKVVSYPGFTGLQDQSWWCGYGPFDKPSIVVCALIENGGFGADAAAPAAAQVFASYFGEKFQLAGPIHGD